MPKKESKNPMQKGKRRQMLHRDQNNIGNDKNVVEYTDFNGNSIE